MNVPQNNLAEILTKCEANGTAPDFVVQKDSYKEQKTSFFAQQLPVRTKPVIYNTNGEEIFVVSDLHIAAGRNYAGVYKGTENFFADDSFNRFLSYANEIKKNKSAILVINGDIFDFLRVTDFPGKVKQVRISKRIKYLLKLQPLKKPAEPSKQVVNDDYDNWLNELKKLGINKTKQELEQSISEKEMKYGLQTDDYKTIYKFIKIKNGHPVFFSALSQWLESGNKLIILKGNHDLEVCWLAVRNYLRLILAENIADKNQNVIEEVLTKIVLPNINFIDDSVEIDKDFYVEHGHRYDKFCMILESPVLKNNPAQLNIPFGSFFNRYLLNRIELFYPFLDNVRPSGNVLSILLKENFPLGLKIIIHHLMALAKFLFIDFRYLRFMLNRVFWVTLAILLPVAALIFFNLSRFQDIPDDISKIKETGGIVSVIFETTKSFGLLFLSYLLARIVSWFQLTEPSSLDKFAKERFKGTDYKIIAMGHTHNPGEYVFEGNKRFYNTGTWIPVIETSTAEVREDKTYTFLHLIRDESGRLQPAQNGLLQRWNDNAGRAEKQILLERK